MPWYVLIPVAIIVVVFALVRLHPRRYPPDDQSPNAKLHRRLPSILNPGQRREPPPL